MTKTTTATSPAIRGSTSRLSSAGLKAKSQPQRVYERIKDMILTSELQPGAYVLHEELSERLGVSRTPVREALIRLEQEGLVENRPRHGVRALPVSTNDMRDIYQILAALESTAARTVAERGLDPSSLAQLKQAVDDMDKALMQDDLDAWVNADSRFHRLLVEFSGNARLIGIVATVVDQSHRVRLLTLRLRPKPTASNRDHRAVVEAIRKRRPDVAGEVHYQHRKKNGEMLIQILERLNLRTL